MEIRQNMHYSAPSNILINYEISSRTKKLAKKTFLEIGCGNGVVSNVLLKNGYCGVGLDINELALGINQKINNSYILSGSYEITRSNFFEYEFRQKFDIIIAHMVLEHFDSAQVDAFFERSKQLLEKDGIIVVIVPSNMKHWGIEDEVAGHMRRYNLDDFIVLGKQFDLKLIYHTFLTYPLANLLSTLSNYIVAKKESHLMTLSKDDQTINSGLRGLMYKTEFPDYFRFIINKFMLYPFILLQKLFKANENSMILYAEFKLGTDYHDKYEK